MLRFLSALLLTVTALSVVSAKDKPMNVLFIAVDDLRPILGCYGDPDVKSPNIDALAKTGTLFNRAYCQQAVCSPSRTSLMTGERPDTTHVWDLQTHFRDHIPNVVTLPQQFKNNGYFCQGIGKIYHSSLNDKASWSVPWIPNGGGKGFGPEGVKILGRLKAKAEKKDKVRGLPYEAPEVEDDFLTDGSTAKRACELVKECKERDKPFFLAVGFLKPHLPFVAPKKYWDMYDADDLYEPATSSPPKGAPDYAPTGFGELRQYYGMPQKGPVDQEDARKLIHGYYACVSYTDAQIGRVLKQLDESGLRENTVVVLWGDHGWHLGDHGMWCKHTNYEFATRAPLIISMPAQAKVGTKTNALVEFVDIYPTIVEACSLPKVEGKAGRSLVPLLNDPAKVWAKAAFSQFPRPIGKHGPGMGYAMRTDRYRFVKWIAKKDGFAEYELYDLERDPNETVNLAADPANAKLLEEMQAMFTKLNPN